MNLDLSNSVGSALASELQVDRLIICQGCDSTLPNHGLKQQSSILQTSVLQPVIQLFDSMVVKNDSIILINP
jgi:hypothetical protein